MTEKALTEAQLRALAQIRVRDAKLAQGQAPRQLKDFLLPVNKGRQRPNDQLPNQDQ